MGKIIDFIKKYYILIIPIVALIVILIVVFSFTNRKGTFSIDDNNYVTIECPETAAIGGTVTCDIKLKKMSKNVLGVKAIYDLADKLEYVSFDVNDDNFELYSVDENGEESSEGFVVINTDGVSEEALIGTLTVKVGDDSLVNTNYQIGLTDIELTDDVMLEDGSYEMIDLSNTADSIRTLNNVATLSNIEIAGGTFDKTFNSDTLEYKVTVSANTETITINHTTTDKNATLSGNGIGSNLALHYGTNTYTIIVTAEDGQTKKTYTINVYREYEFSTNVYVYNKDKGYIYTKNDNNEAIINNIEKLGANLSYNIDNDNLEVLYVNEKLVSMKIVNFDTNYLINNSNIYVSEKITLSNLLSKMTSNDVTFKLFDTNNNEVTDSNAVIGKNYKLNIYYNNDKIDSYTLIPEYVIISDDLIIDTERKIIKRISINTTFGDIIKEIDTSGTIEISSSNKQNASTTDVVATGDNITIVLNDSRLTYTLSVLGDVVGDGVIRISDVQALYAYYRSTKTGKNMDKNALDDAQVAAGDLFNAGSIGLNDVQRIYAYHRKRVTSLEGEN